MSNQEYAITFTSVEQAELVTREPDPKPLGPHEVMGRAVKSLVSPGTELAGYQGQWQWAKYPMTPGYATVFAVEAVGSEVTDLHAGDLVFCMGGHQSCQRVPRDYAVPLPQGLAPDVAPFARLMCVTMSTLTTTTARPPAKVIVTGLGIVGHLAAQLFSACGYEVIAVDPLEARRAAIARKGVSQVLPAIPLDDPSVVGKVALVVECSGHEQAALDACKVVQKRGEVVIVAAMWKQRTSLSAFDLLNTVFNRYVVVRSGWEWELPLLPADFRLNSLYGNIAGAMQWLADGRVNVDGLAELASPRDAQQVYQQLLHQPGKALSALFDWTML
ncbi:MAG: zinc-binding alcohol dehydrogenase [Chloroflexi bacterium]|nr:zinc-binding alcohol dehydrogenase [Chloroflexota bacterium]